MRYRLLLFTTICGFIFNISNSQNTVGTVLYTEDVEEGYTLFTLHKQTFLINNCGQVINQWTSDYKPGNAVYLLEDGSILRAGNTETTDIVFGGNGGIVEKFSWDGELIWSYLYDTTEHKQHHDVYPMPNGNVLILAVTVLEDEEAISLGRDPDKVVGRLYNERIIEVEPIGTNSGNIVWEWNFIDHIIQDFDSSKANFGLVADNPQKVDFNFLNGFDPSERWLHINSMQYDEKRDQIVLSTRFLSELYIIDHSTSTAEAASSSGGIYGMGGDFLYRWGNPQAYGQGTSEDQLIGQHYPYIIPDGLREEGNIILFDNRAGLFPLMSEVKILELPESSLGIYPYTPNTSYGPDNPHFTFNESGFFSSIVSSAQMLPNDNILICEGASGEIFEIDINKNTVWKYIVPIDTNNGNILTQGEDPESITNRTFRAYKYTPDYPAFTGRDLTPMDPIENNPNITQCLVLGNPKFLENVVSFYPNPVIDRLNIKSEVIIEKLFLYDLTGKRIDIELHDNYVDLSDVSSGLYLVEIYFNSTKISKRLIKN